MDRYRQHLEFTHDVAAANSSAHDIAFDGTNCASYLHLGSQLHEKVGKVFIKESKRCVSRYLPTNFIVVYCIIYCIIPVLIKMNIT